MPGAGAVLIALFDEWVNIHILILNEALMFSHEHSNSHAFFGFIR